MHIHFNTYPKYLAINWSFINITNILDLIRFSEMRELSIVVGSAAVKTRTKALVPEQPVKFGRDFRRGRTRAEFLARVFMVESLMGEMIRRNAATGSPIPIVKIMMLCEREF
jgi:hypothetical protein